MRDDLAQQLRRDEGVVEHAYVDSVGWTTISVGRLIDQRKGVPALRNAAGRKR